MSRRLITSTLAVVLVVVALLGIPLAVVEARSIEARAKDQVRAEAVRLLTTTELRLELDQPVDARSFVGQVEQDRYAVIRLPGRSAVAIGRPITDANPLKAELVGARGEVVTVLQSRDDVDAETSRATVLILVTALLAIGAAAGMAVLQARRLGAPLVDLARAAERLGSGDPRPPDPRRYGLPELDRVAQVLDSSARRISRMLAAERQLAADASHQLRTPLTALSMRLEEIVATDDPATVKEEATIALTQVERLTDVVERLLTNAREPRVSGALAIDVDGVVRQQVEEWRPAFDNASRRITVTGHQGLRAVATPGALTHIVATLLENALMHGGGTVTVRLRATGGSVVVEVTDEGPGVPVGLGARVFERSVSGRNSTGLGLAVARDLAEADGGRLELVQQRPPVFAVFLKAHKDDGPGPAGEA